jgi:hypothetical protein
VYRAVGVGLANPRYARRWCYRDQQALQERLSNDGVNGSDGASGQDGSGAKGEDGGVVAEDRLAAVGKCSASLRIVTTATSSFVVAMSTFRMVALIRSR